MRILAQGCAAILCLAAVARAQPPIETYGNTPVISALSISPDGKHYAYIGSSSGEDVIAVSTVGGALVGGVKAGDLKARHLWFSDNDHVVVIASETKFKFGFRGEFENSGAYAYSLPTKKMQNLLVGSEDLFPAQTGLGRVVGVDGGGDVFMPAFMGERIYDPSYDLLRVDLESGKGRVAALGGTATIDWFVDRSGTVVAREDFDAKNRIYRILTRADGSFREIYREDDVRERATAAMAIGPDGKSIIIATSDDRSNFTKLSSLSIEDGGTAPVFSGADRDIEQMISDSNRNALGVRYAGVQPSYEFFDPRKGEIMAGLAGHFADASVNLQSWTEDFSRLIVLVEGGAKAPAFYLYDAPSKKLTLLARRYEGLADADIGPVELIEYKARDGRVIPALITIPPGIELGQTMPMIVMPHGGPAAYDAVGFDWMAQYFASRGHLVLQPNFRGSAGFGAEHLIAGEGEWGGKMQDDNTDGVRLLIKNKWADADRICIIGGSYGGYAALAGGAFTPELYKCVAALAPVADLPQWLGRIRHAGDSQDVVFRYWTRLIGNLSKDRARLEAVSPTRAAAAFAAPVLLLHGDDDTVVPIAQSLAMESALKKAGKPVRLVRLKGEDHWLSVSQTRLQALKELDAFVAAAIGE